jgi:hypothetical protein
MTLERARSKFGKFIGSLVETQQGDIGIIIDVRMDGGSVRNQYPCFVIEWYTNKAKVLYKSKPSWHTVTGILCDTRWKIS